MKRRTTIGTKLSVTALAIKAGLVDDVDGQIYDEKNFQRDITKLLSEKGYTMCPKKATAKVRTWAKNKSHMTYGC